MNDSTKEAWTGGKNISPEAMEKRKKINKKIFKFGCLPIIVLLGLIMLIAILSDNESVPKNQTAEYNDPLNIGRENVKALEGQKVPFDKWSEWGNPQTLEGTDNQLWIVYLDSANISFVSDKSSQIIEFADFGPNSATNYLNEKNAKRKEQLKTQFSEWDGSHIKLTIAIKSAMNDPKSYEHVETAYWDMGDHLIVQTKYRGNNAFGGKVLGMIKAKVNLNGDVIEVIDQQ